jgi:hypothetical protein
METVTGAEELERGKSGCWGAGRTCSSSKLEGFAKVRLVDKEVGNTELTTSAHPRRGPVIPKDCQIKKEKLIRSMGNQRDRIAVKSPDYVFTEGMK